MIGCAAWKELEGANDVSVEAKIPKYSSSSSQNSLNSFINVD